MEEIRLQTKFLLTLGTVLHFFQVELFLGSSRVPRLFMKWRAVAETKELNFNLNSFFIKIALLYILSTFVKF